METLKVNNTMDASAEYYHCTLLSIDAWRDDCGWTWNDCFKVERDIYIAHDSRLIDSTRLMLAWMRRQGWLTDASKGRVTIDWHGDMMDGLLCEVLDKGTREPLLALSSVH